MDDLLRRADVWAEPSTDPEDRVRAEVPPGTSAVVVADQQVEDQQVLVAPVPTAIRGPEYSRPGEAIGLGNLDRSRISFGRAEFEPASSQAALVDGHERLLDHPGDGGGDQAAASRLGMHAVADLPAGRAEPLLQTEHTDDAEEFIGVRIRHHPGNPIS